MLMGYEWLFKLDLICAPGNLSTFDRHGVDGKA